MTNDPDDTESYILNLSEEYMAKLERLATKAGRTPDDQATYILKVMFGLQSADHDDKTGRQIAILFQRMFKNKPQRG